MRIPLSYLSMALAATCVCCFTTAALGQSQHYDLLLKGGHVIDPANRIDGVLDVAIEGGKLAAVEKIFLRLWRARWSTSPVYMSRPA